MLRQEGPQERIYEEIKTIEDNDFRWQEQVCITLLVYYCRLDVQNLMFAIETNTGMYPLFSSRSIALN